MDQVNNNSMSLQSEILKLLFAHIMIKFSPYSVQACMIFIFYHKTRKQTFSDTVQMPKNICTENTEDIYIWDPGYTK